MNKITKKTIKRIEKGSHNDLIESIEFLIDSYNEDKFDSGYKSCLEDLSVRSWRLAEHIFNTPRKGVKKGKDEKGEPLMYFDTVDDLAKVIEDYFTKALNKNE